jgi:TRAP-type C4-dicarboxylate transport system permease small subunit
MTQQPPTPSYAPQPPNHPQATTALVLGILGLVVCGAIAPFAWNIGSKAVQEIDASGGAWGGRTEANAGRILGMVGTALLVVALLAFVMFLLVFVALGSTTFSIVDSTQHRMGL